MGTFHSLRKYHAIKGKANIAGNHVGPEAGKRHKKIRPASLGLVQKLSRSQHSRELMQSDSKSDKVIKTQAVRKNKQLCKEIAKICRNSASESMNFFECGGRSDLFTFNKKMALVLLYIMLQYYRHYFFQILHFQFSYHIYGHQRYSSN